MALNAVRKSSVTSEIMEEIQSAMADGTLRRGSRLPPEPQLASNLQVSRASLREVLKVLEFLGIIETHRGTGTFVAEKPRLPVVDPLVFLLLLQDGSREQLIELRFLVESTFTKLAQQRLEQGHIAQLEESIILLRNAAGVGVATADHDLAFHRIILEATGNPFVIQVGNSVFELFRDSIGRGVQEYPNAAIAHHDQILAALVSGEPGRVDAAIGDSYANWRHFVGARSESPVKDVGVAATPPRRAE
jgi:GntR family transcriptional regulator, transcriptional repressor for pyruvate dehydrogenase complex